MAISLWLLLHIPTAILGLLMVGLSAVLPVTGLLVVRRRGLLTPLESGNEVASHFIGIIGTAYAILLAFVIFATWEKFTEADTAVTAEANNLGDLIRITQQFSDPLRRELTTRIRSYTLSVTRDEWKSMARAEASPQTFAALNSMWQAYSAIEPQTERGRLLYGESLRHLTQVSDYRRVRIQEAGATIPSPLWVVLLLGWATTIGFTYFISGKSLRAQALMTAWLGGAFGLLLFVILLLSLPFTGDVSVSPAAFDQVFKLLDLTGPP
jgi:hypothetical protein